MKKYVLFTLLLSGLAVQQSIPQTKNPLSTEYSGFETLVQTLPVNEDMRVVMAVYWDRLPDVTQAQKDRKMQLADAYKKRFGELPTNANFKIITAYKEYFDKTEALKVRYRSDAQRLNQNLKGLQTAVDQLRTSEAKTSQKLLGLQSALSILSSTLGTLGGLLGERDTALTSGESVASEDVIDLTKKIAAAQKQYKVALNNLKKAGSDVGLSIKLDNDYLNLVTKSALAESGIAEEFVKEFEEEAEEIKLPEEEEESATPAAT